MFPDWTFGRNCCDTWKSLIFMELFFSIINCSWYFSFKVYQVAYVIVKAANSPRPGNWILERSLDGVTYKPWQYYAISDSECWNTYGIEPTIGIPKFKSDDDVLCLSQYSRLDPLRNGEVSKTTCIQPPTYGLCNFFSQNEKSPMAWWSDTPSPLSKNMETFKALEN